jgi:hypothetical protein
MAVSPQRGFAADQRRALRLLAAAPNGATEAIMLAHGFTNAMLDALVRDGLATAERRLQYQCLIASRQGRGCAFLLSQPATISRVFYFAMAPAGRG